jgi:hypothetical protein
MFMYGYVFAVVLSSTTVHVLPRMQRLVILNSSSC